MARYHGKNGKAVVNGTGQVSEVSDWSLSLSRDFADASAMGNDSKNSLAGQYSGTVSITCSYDPSDAAGQESLNDAFLSSTTVALTLYEQPPATGVKYWSADFYVEKADEKVPVGGKVERTFNLRLEGDIQRQTVP